MTRSYIQVTDKTDRILVDVLEMGEILKPSDIITTKGGPAAFAQKIQHSEGAVRVWKHRERFPRGCWPDLMQAYPDLTLEYLLQLEKANGQLEYAVDRENILTLYVTPYLTGPEARAIAERVATLACVNLSEKPLDWGTNY